MPDGDQLLPLQRKLTIIALGLFIVIVALQLFAMFADVLHIIGISVLISYLFINIVDWLWQYAFDQRASDIHLEPKRDFSAIRFRIDGILHQVYQVPAIVMIAMTARIKLLGRMDVIEKRRPQDGRGARKAHAHCRGTAGAPGLRAARGPGPAGGNP